MNHHHHNPPPKHIPFVGHADDIIEQLEKTRNPNSYQKHWQNWRVKYADRTGEHQKHVAHVQFHDIIENNDTGWFHTDPQTGIKWTYGASWYNHFKEKLETPHGPALAGIVHQYNNDGYHGPDLHHNPDTLTLGCSVTGGVGLPHDYTWPHIYAKVTGNTVNNIGVSGAGAQQQAQSALIYIKKYGKPKEILFLVPPLDRYWTTTVTPTGLNQTSTLHYDYQLKAYTHGKLHKPVTHRNIDNTKTSYSLDQAIHANLHAIENLQYTCEILDIELKLSSWENSTWTTLNVCPHIKDTPPPQHMIRNLKDPNDWKKYAHSSKDKTYNHWGAPHPVLPRGSRTNCQCGLNPQNDYQNQFWDHALDIDHGQKRKNPHPGLHLQIHYAELFTNKPITNQHLKNHNPFWHNTNIHPPDKSNQT